MLRKWKQILINWINCYFNESFIYGQKVSLESLINIISYLRKNLSLDESRSSNFDAHTVEEFIVEKYPEFKFENGTVEPANEEDVYIVASLLLFFVCVNSKDVDIKNAMCSKLSAEDQEIILKFSKSLMDCHPISYGDIQAAIIDACGQELASSDVASRRLVTIEETPPALRSLHGEVRRLQAALDAERFDRNFLQEELSRTNLKLEKLLKDKEQYKLDIVNLKAKISMCCGQEAEAKNAENSAEVTTKLSRQLQQLEEKLIETQGQLDDMQYERDTYKARIEELKQERDKWLVFSQQETSQVTQLTEELEAERRHVLSLRDLVTELRQHNQLNRFDSSQLECDDPDTSVHSVHNLSVCSEACANVVEVQLGEERAKIVVLRQQIQTLQDQLNDLNKKSIDEKQELENMLSEKENVIFNLKHQIHGEIEEKNNIKARFDDEISRQRLELQKQTEFYNTNLESRTRDIQNLQKENQSLHNELNDVKLQLEVKVHSLKEKLIDNENLTDKLKRTYECQIDNLNVMVTNLTNYLRDKTTELDLFRKEKEKLQQIVDENIEVIRNLEEEVKTQKQSQEKLINDFESERVLLKNMIVNSESVMEDQKNAFNKLIAEHQKINETLQEKNKALQDTLYNERKTAGTKVQEVNTMLDGVLKELSEEKSKKEYLETDKQVLEREIDTLRNKLNLKESQIEKLEAQNEELENILHKCRTDFVLLEENYKELKIIKDSKESELLNEVSKLSKALDEQIEVNTKLQMQLEERIEQHTHIEFNVKQLTDQINGLIQEKNQLDEINKEYLIEINKLHVNIDENREVIQNLEEEVKTQKQQQEKLINDFESEKVFLKNIVTDTESIMEDQRNAFNKLIAEHLKTNETLQEENKALQEETKALQDMLDNEKKTAETKVLEVNTMLDGLLKELSEEKSKKEYLETEKQVLEREIDTLRNMLHLKESQIEKLELQNEEIDIILQKYRTVIQNLEEEVKTQKQHQEKLINDFESERVLLKNMVTNSESVMDDQRNAFNKLIAVHQKTNETLQEENKALQDMLDNEKKTAETKVQEANTMLDGVLKELSEEKTKKEYLETQKNVLDKEIDTLRNMLNMKESQFKKLESENKELESILQKYRTDFVLIEENYNELKIKKDSIETELLNEVDKLSKALDEQIEVNTKLQTQLEERIEQHKHTECNVKQLTDQINELIKEKSQLEEINKEYFSKINKLQANIDENTTVIKNLEEEVKTQKQSQEKLINDFESERVLLKNMITNSESVMEDQKISLNKLIQEHQKTNVTLQEENKTLQEMLDNEKKTAETKVQEANTMLDGVLKELSEEKSKKEYHETQKQNLDTEIYTLKNMLNMKDSQIEKLESQNKELEIILQRCKTDIALIEEKNNELKIKKDSIQIELQNEIEKLSNALDEQVEVNTKLQTQLDKRIEQDTHIECKVKQLMDQINELNEQKSELEKINKEYCSKIDELQANINALTNNFESERLLLKNMVTDTESVVEEQKSGFNKLVAEHLKCNEALQEENKALKYMLDNERKSAETKVQEANTKLDRLMEELSEEKRKMEYLETEKQDLDKEIDTLRNMLNLKESQIEKLESQSKELENILQKCRTDIALIEENNNELKIKKDSVETELLNDVDKLSKALDEQIEVNTKLETQLEERIEQHTHIECNVKQLTDQINELIKQKSQLQIINNEYSSKIDELKANIDARDSKENEEISQLKKDNVHLVKLIEENKTVITNLEQLIKHELKQNQQLREDTGSVKANLVSKCSLLQEYQVKAEKLLEERQKEIHSLKDDVNNLKQQLEQSKNDLKCKEQVIAALNQAKDTLFASMSKELVEDKANIERCQKELESKDAVIKELRQQLEEFGRDVDQVKALRRENDELVKAIGQIETFSVAVASQEKSSNKYSGPAEKDTRGSHHQVDNTSDLTHSSMDSIKTISDLEKIIYDKNRTITTLQSDITYLKSLMAESENKLLDVTKELEMSQEHCQQLSAQLKKIVHQKNEEIAELKKQVSKMSATENRATQIIKVSAKYQAIILKRIAEIKNNTVLKELTNFGNAANCDNELRRTLNAGTITMEDLENFLETTDRHLKRCSEKQLALQKEKDRLAEVNKIHESEIINLKKFLTELSVSFKTFSNVKDLYGQKLSKVVSIQRTVRREILNLDGHITDATMCKLERGYAAVMQDLSECSMNMERWVERCIGRTISPEKIKQAFTSENERLSLASTTFQNTSLEIHLEELEKSFQKLLEEVIRAQKGEGAKDAQAVTLMEVRAEYEDKLNRMKAKMKQLYHEQIAIFQEKQKEEVAVLERELQKARDKMAESSKAYEEHIRALTTELWSVGEKFLIKKDEAEWLRRKQRSGSLMSLQHVHSSGLVLPQEEQPRPSDTHSLRSLPVNNNATNNNKREGRMHMSDEEGEVFDNRWLKELASTPRRPISSPPRESGQRISELQWRNSLCPPHLKSSYPAETQFAPTIDEDDIKCSASNMQAGRQQRKEVGITAYKKPGPPTPSKQAGRLSATDSELRESLRVEADPQPSRKTSTPSRIRLLFKSSRNDTADGTPRTKRLSIFRRK